MILNTSYTMIKPERPKDCRNEVNAIILNNSKPFKRKINLSFIFIIKRKIIRISQHM